MKKNILKIYLISSLIVLIPLSTQAFFWDDFFEDWENYFEEDSFDSVATSSSVQIINQVNVSAKTGGNVVGQGEEETGEAEVKVKVETIINEQVIEPIDIEIKSKDEEAKVEVEQKITVDEGQEPQVEREIEINRQSETIEPVLEKISNWWSSFLEDLRTTLINIFKF